MILIRCTRRLLKNVGEVLSDPAPPKTPLGEWYANAIPLPFRGRWLVLYTNAETLLTVLVPGRSLTATVPRFRRRVGPLLQRLGARPQWIARNWTPDEEVGFARTADRRILGTMNDLAFQAQVEAEYADDFDRLDLDTLELQLAETPLSLLHYEHPAHVVQPLFATHRA